MGLLGIISGTLTLQGKGFFAELKEKTVKNEYGEARVLLSRKIAFIPRHGQDPKHYILPHRINHPANLKALKDLGVDEVIGINSTGSLKKKTEPWNHRRARRLHPALRGTDGLRHETRAYHSHAS